MPKHPENIATFQTLKTLPNLARKLAGGMSTYIVKVRGNLIGVCTSDNVLHFGINPEKQLGAICPFFYVLILSKVKRK